MKRYSAKILFQYRSDCGKGRSDVMRRCEQRIIVLFAMHAQSALKKAKAYGRKENYEALSQAGNPIHFEFVGVLDLLELGNETNPEEVWYDIVIMKTPSERRDKLIPKESNLNAIFFDRQKKAASKSMAKKLRA